MDLGQSFLPGGDEQQRLRPEGGGPINPVQEAIKTLALRLPRVLGAGSPAPPQLMNSLGGAAMDNPLAQIMLQMFAPRPQMAPGGSPQTPATNPKVQFEDPRGALPFTPNVLPTENAPAPRPSRPPSFPNRPNQN